MAIDPKKKRPIVPPMAPRDMTAAMPSRGLPRQPLTGDVDLANPSTSREVEHTMGSQPWDAHEAAAPASTPSDRVTYRPPDFETPYLDGEKMDSDAELELKKFNGDVNKFIKARKRGR